VDGVGDLGGVAEIEVVGEGPILDLIVEITIRLGIDQHKTPE
jgi:hypothetical protein